MGLGGEGGSCVRSMVQRLVVGDLVPVRIVAPSREMSMVFLGWNVAVQPWLQSRPMDRREPEERAGKMWATHAAAGRCGRSRVAVWVEVMVVPSGRRTEMPGEAVWRLRWGVAMWM